MVSCMCVWLCTSVDQQVVEKFIQLLNSKFNEISSVSSYHLVVMPVSQASKKIEFTKGISVVCYHSYHCYGYMMQNYNGDSGVYRILQY